MEKLHFSVHKKPQNMEMGFSFKILVFMAIAAN